MNAELRDAKVQSARLALERNRAELRAALEPAPLTRHDTFPRSATFRWLTEHVTPRALASTAMAAALGRVPFGRLIGNALFSHRN